MIDRQCEGAGVRAPRLEQEHKSFRLGISMETIGHRVFSTLVLFAFLFLAFIVFLAWIAPDHVGCDPAFRIAS